MREKSRPVSAEFAAETGGKGNGEEAKSFVSPFSRLV